jgi:hypothetical protein
MVPPKRTNEHRGRSLDQKHNRHVMFNKPRHTNSMPHEVFLMVPVKRKRRA